MSLSDQLVSALFPQVVGPHPLDPQQYTMTHIYVQDIGHEQDAYYRLGWHCISRHDRFALLCTDGINEELKFLLMEMQ